MWDKVSNNVSIKYISDINKQVYFQNKFLHNLTLKQPCNVIKVNEYSFLVQISYLDWVKHMSLSEDVSHRDKFLLEII